MFTSDIFSAELDQYLASFKDYELYHSPSYLQQDAKGHGGTPWYWLDAPNPTFIIPLIRRPVPGKIKMLTDCVSPYGYPGFLSRSENLRSIHRALRQFSREAAQLNIVSTFLRLNPFSSSPNIGRSKYYSKHDHGNVVYIDLNSDYESIRTDYSQNHRRTLKKLSSLGFAAHWEGEDFLDQFVRVYHQTMQRLDASSYYFFDHAYYRSLLNSCDCRFVSVTDANGIVAACGLFLISPTLIQYHLGATDSRYLNTAPSKLMFDFVIREFATTDQYFVLGGGLGGRMDDLYRFKTGFSPHSLPFSTLRMIHQPECYLSLCQGLETFVSYGLSNEFFPPYRLL